MSTSDCGSLTHAPTVDSDLSSDTQRRNSSDGFGSITPKQMASTSVLQDLFRIDDGKLRTVAVSAVTLALLENKNAVVELQRTMTHSLRNVSHRVILNASLLIARRKRMTSSAAASACTCPDAT